MVQYFPFYKSMANWRLKGKELKLKIWRQVWRIPVDCPIINDEIRELLYDVERCKRTFAELKREASRIKEVKEVQRQFIAKTGCKNWVEVKERLVNLQKGNDDDGNERW